MKRCCTARQGRKGNNLTSKTAECIWFMYLHHKIERKKSKARRKKVRKKDYIGNSSPSCSARPAALEAAPELADTDTVVEGVVL